MKTRSGRTLYHKIVWITVALSGLVFFEPAPYDILVVLLFLFGFTTYSIRFPKKLMSAILLLWLFVLGNLLSLFFAKNAISSCYFLAITIYLMISWLFFVAYIYTYRDYALTIVVNAYIFAGMITAILGILSYSQNISFIGASIRRTRVLSTFKDPNVFGPFLVFPAIICLVRMEQAKKSIKAFWGLSFLLLSGGILLSYSRAAWLGYLVSILFYIIFRLINEATLAKRVKLLLYISLIIVVALIALGYTVQTPRVEKIFFSRLRLQQYDTQIRFLVQRSAITDSFAYPLGIGPGQFSEIYVVGAHNIYIRAWIENGFIGFISLFLFLILTLGTSIKLMCQRNNPNRAFFDAISGCLIGLYLTGFFIDTIHWRHLWLLLAIPWAYRSNNLLHGG